MFVFRSFPEIAPRMANHLRKFVTAPLPIFEFEFTPGTRTPPPLIAAAKCLALCIDVSYTYYARNVCLLSVSLRPGMIWSCLTCIRFSTTLLPLAKKPSKFRARCETPWMRTRQLCTRWRPGSEGSLRMRSGLLV